MRGISACADRHSELKKGEERVAKAGSVELVAPSPMHLTLRITAVAAGFAGHALLFGPAYSLMGPCAALLIALPVLLAGWTLGMTAGAASALLALPVNAALFDSVGISNWEFIFRQGGLVGTLMVVVTGAGIGQLRDLSERFRTQIRESAAVQTTLMETEELHRAVLDNVADAIAINVETERVFVNRAFLKLHGLEDIPQGGGIPIDDYLHPDDVALVRQRTLARQHGESVPGLYQYRIVRKDGAVRTVQTSAVAITYKGQSAALAVLRDVTEQSEAQRALERSEERYRALFEESRDAIFIASETGQIVDINPSGLALFGYSMDFMRGMKFRKLLFTPEDECLYLQELEQRGSVEECRLKMRRQDGSSLEVLLTATVRISDDGSASGYQGIIRDVTELQVAQESLDRARRYSELILNSAGDGIYGVDRDWVVTFVNPAAAEMIGWRVHQFVGQPEHLAVHHSHSDGTPYRWDRCPIHTSITEGSVHQVGDEVFWRRDGLSIPVEYISTPIVVDDEITGAVIAFRDITNRLEVERMKHEFVSVVSHELRTPLTSIRGSLGLLAGTMADMLPDKGKRMLIIAVDNTERLTRLINDILDLERMSSGKMTMSRRACNGADLVAQAIDAMRAMAEKAQVTLSASVPAARLWADPDRVIQVLTNLLSNAIKFSEPETSVCVETQLLPGCIRFQVRDAGRGIPTDKLRSIFRQFQQVDASDSRKESGTGLGLAICHTIIGQHDGEIWAESVDGEGSTFFFTLPFAGNSNAPDYGESSKELLSSQPAGE